MTQKIVIISDTHCQLSQVKVPEGDILIHCGDFTYSGIQPELIAFGNHLRKLNHRYKILVPGNHDMTLDPLHDNYHSKAESWMRLKESEILAINKLVSINGLNIFCTPMVPKMSAWAFAYSDTIQKEIYDDASNFPIDIVVSHSPPRGVLDGDAHEGSTLLKEFIQKVKPKYHLFGHCHGNYGQIEIDGVKYINAATCNMSYYPVHKPIVIEV